MTYIGEICIQVIPIYIPSILLPVIYIILHRQMFSRKKIFKRKMCHFSSFLCSTYLLCNVGPSSPVRNNVLCARFCASVIFKQDGTIPKVQDPHFAQQKQKLEDGWKNLHFALCLLSCELWESASWDSFSRQKTSSNTTTAVGIPRTHGRN